MPETDDPVIVDDQTDPPKRKGRGRPRKEPDPEAPVPKKVKKAASKSTKKNIDTLEAPRIENTKKASKSTKKIENPDGDQPKKPNIKWTPEMVVTLLKLRADRNIDELLMGVQSKPQVMETWDEVREDFCIEMKMDIGLSKLKTKYQNLRWEYHRLMREEKKTGNGSDNESDDSDGNGESDDGETIDGKPAYVEDLCRFFGSKEGHQADTFGDSSVMDVYSDGALEVVGSGNTADDDKAVSSDDRVSKDDNNGPSSDDRLSSDDKGLSSDDRSPATTKVSAAATKASPTTKKAPPAPTRAATKRMATAMTRGPTQNLQHAFHLAPHA
ncbi:hypothetical protein HDU76_009187 [Blyttiomyces sp. JEL0837]|nr:hypothetical protein HDU76_009187 [Blyttiomyces sp. JEL0837]